MPDRSRVRGQPTIELAGHGDEPAEAQAFIAAGHGVTVAHDLNVLISPEQITGARLVDGAPSRHIQAAIMRENRSPAARAVIDALREVGRRRAQQHSVPLPATHRNDATTGHL